MGFYKNTSSGFEFKSKGAKKILNFAVSNTHIWLDQTIKKYSKSKQQYESLNLRLFPFNIYNITEGGKTLHKIYIPSNESLLDYETLETADVVCYMAGLDKSLYEVEMFDTDYGFLFSFEDESNAMILTNFLKSYGLSLAC